MHSLWFVLIFEFSSYQEVGSKMQLSMKTITFINIISHLAQCLHLFDIQPISNVPEYFMTLIICIDNVVAPMSDYFRIHLKHFLSIYILHSIIGALARRAMAPLSTNTPYGFQTFGLPNGYCHHEQMKRKTNNKIQVKWMCKGDAGTCPSINNALHIRLDHFHCMWRNTKCTKLAIITVWTEALGMRHQKIRGGNVWRAFFEILPFLWRFMKNRLLLFTCHILCGSSETPTAVNTFAMYTRLFNAPGHNMKCTFVLHC